MDPSSAIRRTFDPDALLAWYDRNRRDLPWRARPGEAADPYAVWLSEIMLQQTTVDAVAPYFTAFLARWPNVRALAQAPLEEVTKAWAGLGYYARARNLHACARRIAFESDGRFPETREELLSLPGVGPYTAAAIAAIAFDESCVAVDGNVERVVSRLFAIDSPLRLVKAELRAKAQSLAAPERHGDFAQALMELGATVCTPRAPDCGKCPVFSSCEAGRRCAAEAFPVKEAKAAKPRRKGAVFVLCCGTKTLLRRRAPRGLLAGMTEFPSSPFEPDFDLVNAGDFAPVPACWRALPSAVTHVFTHFSLELTVFTATLATASPLVDECRWVEIARLEEEGLPTLMRKVAVHAGLIVK